MCNYITGLKEKLNHSLPWTSNFQILLTCGVLVFSLLHYNNFSWQTTCWGACQSVVRMKCYLSIKNIYLSQMTNRTFCALNEINCINYILFNYMYSFISILVWLWSHSKKIIFGYGSKLTSKFWKCSWMNSFNIYTLWSIVKYLWQKVNRNHGCGLRKISRSPKL